MCMYSCVRNLCVFAIYNHIHIPAYTHIRAGKKRTAIMHQGNTNGTKFGPVILHAHMRICIHAYMHTCIHA